MGTTYQAVGGLTDEIDWALEHGFEPADLSKTVVLNDDGTVTVRQFVLDDHGHKAFDANGNPMVELVTVTPKRPFPTLTEVTGR